MAIIKCKMCGGDLILEEGSNVAECEYCGTRQTVPTADNEKKMNLFARANRLRANNEFDKAAGVYESIVADFPEEAEAYWGLILCKYGIEYVDDPGMGKKIPTCHRSSFDSLMDDQNFELVMEYADPIARRVYRDEAKQIEELRKGIIEVSSKEEPYDIFICYKETAEDGQRTLDSVLAQDVYDMLTENGYRVFFSRVSLENKLGVEYEPYIFAALNSAKIMLAFGTDYDYYNAVWVKNEWSRFLQLIAKGEKKTLIPCFKNLDAYDMPKEFAKLQAQDLGKVGANQDLLRGIKKILPKEDPTAAQAVVRQVVQGGTGPSADSLLRRGELFLEQKEWKSADEYFDKALDISPECAEAYLGKFCATLQQRSPEEAGRYLCSDNWMQDVNGQENPERNLTLSNGIQIQMTEELQKALEAAHAGGSIFRLLSPIGKQTGLGFTETKAAAELLLAESMPAPAAAQKYTTVKADRSKETQLIRSLTIPGYLSEATLQSHFEFDFSIPQPEQGPEKMLQAAEKLISGDSNLACAKRFAAGETAARIGRLEETVLNFWRTKVEAAQKKRMKQRETVLQAYQSHLAEKEASATALHLRATAERDRDYDMAKAMIDEKNYVKALRLLRKVGDYREAPQLLQPIEQKLPMLIRSEQKRQLGLRGLLALNGSTIDNLLLVGRKEDGTLEWTCFGEKTPAFAEELRAFCDVASVAAGKDTLVILKADGTVCAFGRFDSYGQLRVNKWSDIMMVASGGEHTVGLHSNGTVVATEYTFGSKYYSGQCNVKNWKNITAIAAGDKHTVGLRDDGTVVAVGCNDKGQCDVSDWNGIVSIVAGNTFTAGLREDGTVVGTKTAFDADSDIARTGEAAAIYAGRKGLFCRTIDGRILATNKTQAESSRLDTAIDVCEYEGIDCILGLLSDGSVVSVTSEYYQEKYAAVFDKLKQWRLFEDYSALLAAAAERQQLRKEAARAQRQAEQEAAIAEANEKALWETQVVPLLPLADRRIVSYNSAAGGSVVLKSDGTIVALCSDDRLNAELASWRGLIEIASSSNCFAGLCADGTVRILSKEYEFQPAKKWSGIVSIAVSGSAIIGLKTDGTVAVASGYGSTFTQVSNWSDIRAISANYHCVIGLRKDGTVVSAGTNVDNCCLVSSWRNVVAISVGPRQTLGLRADGTVAATPHPDMDKRRSAFGKPDYDGQCHVADWTDVAAVFAGDKHSYGIQKDGTMLYTSSWAGGYSTKKFNFPEARFTACEDGGIRTYYLLKDGRCTEVEYEKLKPTQVRLFNSIESLPEELLAMLRTMRAERQTEADRCKGVFAGKRRKELENELSVIDWHIARIKAMQRNQDI